VLVSASAVAALEDVPESSPDGILTLQSHEYPVHFNDLSPGDPAYWQIGTHLEGAELSTLTLEIERDGELVEHPRGLTVNIERCDTEWTGVSEAGECLTGATNVLTIGPADDAGQSSPVWDLAGLTSTTGKYLRVTLAVDNSEAARHDESLMGLRGTLGLGFTAAGDESMSDPAAPEAPAESVLALTGADAVPLALLAAGLLGLGVSAALLRRRFADREAS
jgi:hypothetical protein